MHATHAQRCQFDDRQRRGGELAAGRTPHVHNAANSTIRCRGGAAPLSFAAVPMYDYRCERCTTQFEVRQSFSDDTLTVCPPAGGPVACVAPGEGAVKKVFSGVAIAFKGDGFYKTDHGSVAKDRRKEKEAASSTDGSSNGSSPSKDSSAKDPSSGSGTGSDSLRSKADAGISPSSSSSSPSPSSPSSSSSSG